MCFPRAPVQAISKMRRGAIRVLSDVLETTGLRSQKEPSIYFKPRIILCARFGMVAEVN
jgi:hypothetical protein